MLAEGLKLMFLGMGVVFTFLVLLLFAIVVAGGLVKRLGLEKAPAPARPSGPKSGGAPNRDVPVAVISAAIAAFRRSRGR